MLVKRRPPRQDNKVHPTKTALIDTVVSMLDSMPVEEITCDAVLAASGISRGSLYYHFTDFGDLIEHALAVRFGSYVDETIRSLDSVVEASASKSEFRDRLLAATEGIRAIVSTNRLERAIPFAAAANSERFRLALGVQQQRLTDAHTNTLRSAQQRGWISRTVDLAAVAVLLQAASLGLVVDDVATTPIEPGAWNTLVRSVLDLVVLAP